MHAKRKNFEQKTRFRDISFPLKIKAQVSNICETREMAASDKASDDSLYPIAVLIDELKNEDIQVSFIAMNEEVF